MEPTRTRWGAIWAVSAVAVMSVVVALFLIASQRAQAARAAALADGFSLDFRELALPELPSARNAALVLAPLVERSERDEALLNVARSWVPSTEGATPELLGVLAALEASGREPGNVLQEAELALRRGEMPPAEELALLRAFLRDAEEELSLVARATQRSSWRFELPQYHGGAGWNAKRPVFLLIGVENTLVLRALLQLDDRDHEGCVESLRQALFVARATADEPTLTSAMARITCLRVALSGLRHALPRLYHEVELGALERELAMVDLRRSMRLAFAGERAFDHWFLRDVAGGGPSMGGAGALHTPTLKSALIRVPLVADLHEFEMLGYWSEAITLAGRPLYEVRDEIAALDLRAQDPPWQASLVRLSIPIAGRLEHAARTEAEVLLAELALVGRRAGLDAAEAAADAALDPLCGAPVRSLRDADGALWIACDADPCVDARGAQPELSWRVP